MRTIILTFKAVLGAEMRNKVLCGLAALAIAAVTIVMAPGQGSAQLFNTDKKKDAPAASGTTSDKTKPQSGSVFNHSGNTGSKPAATPNYGAQKPQGMQARSVTPNSSAGFSRKPAGGESAQDKAIREAAMKRMAAGQAAQAAVLADADRRSMSAEQVREAIENGGETLEEDTRRKVYDKHKNQRDPNAPARLFNTPR